MVESASINKSLFVLAQCVEAIGKKQARIPYRESKMTRILSLGQNNGLTVMILNLAPVRSYHLDTLSSLNFANRTKKIEVNEIENKPFYRPGSKLDQPTVSASQAPAMNRQPLRPKALSHNVVTKDKDPASKPEKPVKLFSVYADKEKPTANRPGHLAGQGHPRILAESQKRTSSEVVPTIGRPSKVMRPSETANKLPRPVPLGMTQKSIEELIERKVSEKLAESAMNMKVPDSAPIPPDVQARLDALEKRIGDRESERGEGLQYLLMAKQHTVRGEDASALKMYQLALPFFPGNEKLAQKMLKVQEKINRKAGERRPSSDAGGVKLPGDTEMGPGPEDVNDAEYHDDAEVQEEQDEEEETESRYRTKARKPRRQLGVFRDVTPCGQTGTESEDELAYALEQTPRTKHILKVINTRDVAQIRLLRGVGAKKAEMIVNCLCEMDDEAGEEEGERMGVIRDLAELGRLKGVGSKGVERMRAAV